MDGKLRGLREILAVNSSALVAYSGGVDSTLLAYLAHAVMGERMKAVTVSSPLLPPRELERAKTIAASLGFPLEVVEVDELSLPGFGRNPPDRCYICKRSRLELLQGMAEREGREAVLEGTNLDDAGMHRPGRRASSELGALSPLEEARLIKADIRSLARELGLPNWDAPSRPCLATRFPYGMELERPLMRRVDTAEEVLEAMGLREVRVRLETPDAARIEVGSTELAALEEKDNMEGLVKKLKGLGFRLILLDLDGYRSGSMDEGGRTRSCRTLYRAEDDYREVGNPGT